MLKWFLSAISGSVITAALKTFFSAVHFKWLTESLNNETAARVRVEDRAAAAERENAQRKEMSDAQANAPRGRSDLAERLRREATELDKGSAGIKTSEGGLDAVPKLEGTGEHSVKEAPVG